MSLLPDDPSTPQESSSFFSKLWRHFLSGILVTAPLALTVYLVWNTIKAIDDMMINLIPSSYLLGISFPYRLPGFGIIIAFVVFTLIGTVAAGFFGRLMVRTGENIVNRMPIVRSIYSAVKQIFEAVFLRDRNSFREVILLEYPRKGIWTLGFVTGETMGAIHEVSGDEVLNVFIPTTPNPTSGFLLFVPRKDVKSLDMTVEEGIKLVVSAGIITPDLPLRPIQTER
jgi:uncharacterized membrane protein